MIAIRKTIFTIFLGILAVAIPTRAAEGVRTITVHANKYKFLPAEITVSKGEPVRLILISDDVDHGLAVKDLGIRADMPKGKHVEVTVTPDQTGDFKGTCSRYCGAGHGSMKFVVHVVDKAQNPG